MCTFAVFDKATIFIRSDATDDTLDNDASFLVSATEPVYAEALANVPLSTFFISAAGYAEARPSHTTNMPLPKLSRSPIAPPRTTSFANSQSGQARFHVLVGQTSSCRKHRRQEVRVTMWSAPRARIAYLNSGSGVCRRYLQFQLCAHR